jgi:TonB family protein
MPTRRSAERCGILAVAILVIAAGVASAGTSQPQVGSNVRACGQVLDVGCDEAGRVSWLVDLGSLDVLLVGTDDVPDPVMVRELALRHGFGRLCVAGRLVRRADPFKLALLAVDAITDIRPEGEPAPDPLGPGISRTCDAGVRLPTVVREQRASYTWQAMGAKIQGAVWVEVLVRVDGKVSTARVVRSLDRRNGLDAEALAAAKRWRFKPGTKDGQPVPMAVLIELKFTLK